jgi:hypothetical protein
MKSDFREAKCQPYDQKPFSFLFSHEQSSRNFPRLSSVDRFFKDSTKFPRRLSGGEQMRIRGRRVALLLMGVLPLLAKDDVPDVNSDDISGENDNDVQAHRHAAEKMHDDALTSIPSLRFVDLTSPSVPTNFVMVDQMFDYQVGFSRK